MAIKHKPVPFKKAKVEEFLDSAIKNWAGMVKSYKPAEYFVDVLEDVKKNLTPFRKKDIKEMLDSKIRSWYEKMRADDTSKEDAIVASYYMDILQAVRIDLFSEILETQSLD